MADQPFRNTLQLPSSDYVRRRRRDAGQDPPPLSSGHRNNYRSSHGRKTSLPTSEALTDFGADWARDSDTELPEKDLGEVRQSDSRPSPTLTPVGSPTVESGGRFGSSFMGGLHETPRIPDEEAPPDPITEPDETTQHATSIFSRIGESTGYTGRPLETEKLVDKVLELFPIRAHLPVQVMDFYEDRAERKLTTLAHIEWEMDPLNKPDDVVVRWIHAPLGVGLFHSSVEDIFLRGQGKDINGYWRRPSMMPKGKDFFKAGRAGWPYLEGEILNVRSTKQMLEARSVAQALFNNEKAQEILNKKVFEGDCNRTLKKDVQWRKYHLTNKMHPTYWETVYSDLPLLLSDGALIMKSPAATKQEPNLKMRAQTLQKDPAYQHAYLVRDSFRCFHRADGFLLTMSPSTGIDHLNRHLPDITRDPDVPVSQWRSEKRKEEESEADKQFPNDSLSLIAHTFAEFQGDGTQRWQHKNAEWLMVYLMTEIARTPSSMRSGYSVATILDAYDGQVSKLIEKKFEPWARNETANLFHAYLRAIDELGTLNKVYERKLTFLKRLDEDCLRIQAEFDIEKKEERRKGTPRARARAKADAQKTPPSEDEELPIEEQITPRNEEQTAFCEWPVITMDERVKFALRAVEDLCTQCKELHTDLTTSLDLMSRLRAIEQNDLVISADHQGKAILILSAVTMIFLPLSFLASYFSMNVQGIQSDPEKPPPTTKGEFWKICGAVAGVLVFLVVIFLWQVSTGNNMRRALAKTLRRTNRDAVDLL